MSTHRSSADVAPVLRVRSITRPSVRGLHAPAIASRRRARRDMVSDPFAPYRQDDGLCRRGDTELETDVLQPSLNSPRRQIDSARHGTAGRPIRKERKDAKVDRVEFDVRVLTGSDRQRLPSFHEMPVLSGTLDIAASRLTGRPIVSSCRARRIRQLPQEGVRQVTYRSGGWGTTRR